MRGETYRAFDQSKRAHSGAGGLEVVTLLQVSFDGYFCGHGSLPCSYGQVTGTVSIHSILWEQTIQQVYARWESILSCFGKGWERSLDETVGAPRIWRDFLPSRQWGRCRRLARRRCSEVTSEGVWILRRRPGLLGPSQV